MHPQLFSRTKSLLRLNLRKNFIDFGDSTRFQFSSYSSTNLREVDLSFNEIKEYPYKLNGITNMNQIKLDHNFITEIEIGKLLTFNPHGLSVNLGFNAISRVDFKNFLPPDGEFNPLTLNLTHNPIICDCNSLDFVKFVQDRNRPIKLEFAQLKCVDSSRNVDEIVDLGELRCSYEHCTGSNENCGCSYRSSDQTVMLDCSSKNLANFPRIQLPIELSERKIELDLHGNRLENLHEVDGYSNVISLNLSQNFLKNLTWPPDSSGLKRLKQLDVRQNLFERIDQVSLESLQKVEKIYLAKNAWNCDCQMRNFSEFLKDYMNQTDFLEIRCDLNGRRLVELAENDFCPTFTETVTIILLPLFMTMLFFLFLFAFYQVYKREILVWLYARGFCLWLVKEDELDKDKTYDAFVSFSHKDEQFVTEKIINVLENRENNFKLCVHVRDWVPGEFITTQIVNSVLNSRRTLVVLSENFLESVWGILEFKTAHMEAMKEGRARVIIVICGHVEMDGLDEELKAYMKNNTYIKWGDPWFWDKLKYALPKSKRNRNGKRRSNVDVKRENLMRFIDEKFEKADKF